MTPYTRSCLNELLAAIAADDAAAARDILRELSLDIGLFLRGNLLCELLAYAFPICPGGVPDEHLEQARGLTLPQPPRSPSVRVLKALTQDDPRLLTRCIPFRLKDGWLAGRARLLSLAAGYGAMDLLETWWEVPEARLPHVLYDMPADVETLRPEDDETCERQARLLLALPLALQRREALEFLRRRGLSLSFQERSERLVLEADRTADSLRFALTLPEGQDLSRFPPESFSSYRNWNAIQLLLDRGVTPDHDLPTRLLWLSSHHAPNDKPALTALLQRLIRDYGCADVVTVDDLWLCKDIKAYVAYLTEEVGIRVLPGNNGSGDGACDEDPDPF